MRKLDLCPLLVFFIAMLCCSSVSFAKEKLAVMDLRPTHGVEESLAKALSVEIRDAIHSFGDYEVLSKEDLASIAERTLMRQNLGCDDTKCLIDFGRAIGTKYMVAGSVSKLGATYSINLRLIDTEGDDAGVKKRVNKKCTCPEAKLFDTAKAVAALAMEKEVPETEIVAEKPHGAVVGDSGQATGQMWEDGQLRIVLEDIVRSNRCFVVMLKFTNRSRAPLFLDVYEYNCYMYDEKGNRWTYEQHKDTARLWAGKQLAPGFTIKSKMSFCSSSSAIPVGDLVLFMESQSDYGGRYPFVATLRGIQWQEDYRKLETMLFEQEEGNQQGHYQPAIEDHSQVQRLDPNLTDVLTNPQVTPKEQDPCFIGSAWL